MRVVRKLNNKLLPEEFGEVQLRAGDLHAKAYFISVNGLSEINQAAVTGEEEARGQVTPYKKLGIKFLYENIVVKRALCFDFFSMSRKDGAI